MSYKKELTLLSEGEIWGGSYGTQLDVLKKYGTKCSVTDLFILTGGYCDENCGYMAPDDNSLKGRTGWCYTRSCWSSELIYTCDFDGSKMSLYPIRRDGGIRPVLLSSYLFSQISTDRVMGYNGTEEIEYLEYPQYAPDARTQIELEREYQSRGLKQTGRNYTFNGTPIDDVSYLFFEKVTYEEYEYNGKKYIRVKANLIRSNTKLSNGETYKRGDYVWLEVSPIKWLIDDRTQTLVSKRALLSGIRFNWHLEEYHGDFSRTGMCGYLKEYMIRDLFQTATLTQVDNMTPNDEVQNKVYGPKK